jgi:hypothetical protein
MKSLVKISGILVLPINDVLVQMTRVSETTWTQESRLPVSFASLIEPRQSEALAAVQLPAVHPCSLKDMCGAVIKTALRGSVVHVPIRKTTACRRSQLQNLRRLRRNSHLVIPILEEHTSAASTSSSDSSSSDDDEDEAEESEMVVRKRLPTRRVVKEEVPRDVEAPEPSAPVAASSSQRQARELRRRNDSLASCSTTSTSPGQLADDVEDISDISEEDEDEEDDLQPRRRQTKRSVSITDEDERPVLEPGQQVRQLGHVRLPVRQPGVKRFHLANVHSESEDTDADKEETEMEVDARKSKYQLNLYGNQMKEKIKQLPLPNKLRLFLNNYRDLD